jgi:hypothetical protein
MDEREFYEQLQEAHRGQEERRQRSMKLWAGLGIGATLIGLLVVLGLPQALLGGDTTTLPGDPQHFAPVAALDEVRELAGPGLSFVGLEARYVRSDGTLDLTESFAPDGVSSDEEARYRPHVRYLFLSDDATGDPPPGAPRPSAPDGVIVVARDPLSVEEKTSVRNRGGHFEINRGLRRYEGAVVGPTTPAPVPGCPLALVWRRAAEAGVPRDALAVIDFDHEGWRLRVEGTSHALRLTPDCRPAD